MEKKELRKVTYHFEQGSMFNGLFHRWLVKKDPEGNEYAMALIEDEGGNMREVQSKHVTFNN